jgi:TfoX/Sxy family transcriptional regulator of competence genes
MNKILLLLCAAFFISSCDGAYKEATPAAAVDASLTQFSRELRQKADGESLQEIGDASNYNSNNSASVRKFIVTASLTLRLKDLKNGEALVADIMRKYNAYSVERTIRNNVLNTTIKVAADAYADCFEELKGVGKVEYFNERREDVTLNYYDIEGRLNTKRELMKKYQGYLVTASNIEEIMAVEKQIAELQNDIERTGEDFTRLNNSIDFSTIRLVLNGPRSDDVYYDETIGDKIKTLFNSFGIYFSTTVTILVGLVIYGIPSLVILFLLYLVLFGRIGILKKVWRRLNDKKLKS